MKSWKTDYTYFLKKEVRKGFIVVTEDFLISGREGDGGWKRKQLELLGLRWPPKKSWMASVIGNEISEETAFKFLFDCRS